jgi:large subunit ribosomal protein L21
VFAIIRTGGRQLWVEPGGVYQVDRLAARPGEELTFQDVLLVGKDSGEIVAGAPTVPGAAVVAVVDGETRGPKVRVFKMKRRKGYRRTKGFRSALTRIRVKAIVL